MPETGPHFPLCCHVAVWPPEPVAHTVTAVEVMRDPLTVFTGGSEGGIIKWSTTQESGSPDDLQGASRGLWPTCFLSGHAALVVALQKVSSAPPPAQQAPHGGKKADSRQETPDGHELLSADRDGWVCVWNPSSGECIRRRQLPPSCSSLGSTTALLHGGRHVALVVESFAPQSRPSNPSSPRTPAASMKNPAQSHHFGHGSGRAGESPVGLVIVDAWTLAATHRLSPLYLWTGDVPAPLAEERHAASEPCLHSLNHRGPGSPLPAIAGDPQAAPVHPTRRKTRMSTLKVFTAAVASHDSTHSEVDEVLAQQFAVGSWDAAWGGMSAEEINMMNQSEKAEDISRGLIRQRLGTSCVVLGVSRDGFVFGWQLDDTIILSTQSLEDVVLASSVPPSTGLLDFLAWQESTLHPELRQLPRGDMRPSASPRNSGSSLHNAESAPQIAPGPALSHATDGDFHFNLSSRQTSLGSHPDHHGSIQATSFSSDGLQLLVVRGQSWQLLESHVPWHAGKDIPVYTKEVACGCSPFEVGQTLGGKQLHSSKLAGGIVLRSAAAARAAAAAGRQQQHPAGAKGTPDKRAGPRPLFRGGGASHQHHHQQQQQQQQKGRHSIDALDLRSSPGKASAGLARASLPGFESANSLSMDIANREAVEDHAKEDVFTYILLWSSDGAGAVLKVSDDRPEDMVLLHGFPPEEAVEGAAAMAVQYRQLGGGPGVLRAVTVQRGCVSETGGEYTQQDTSVALFKLPAEATAQSSSRWPAELRGDEQGGRWCWLSAAWGSLGCAVAEDPAAEADTSGGASPHASLDSMAFPSAPPSEDPAAAEDPEDPESDAERGRVTAVHLIGGDDLSPDMLVHGHASGFISVFPLSAALLPAPPLRRRNQSTDTAAGPSSDPLFGSAPAASAALHHPAVVLTGHVGPVTCFLDTQTCPASSEPSGTPAHPALAQRLQPPEQAASGSEDESLLLSGGKDGTIRGWLLVRCYPTSSRPLFVLHVHTEAVKQLQPSPPSCPPPWDKCVISVGHEGDVCITSLETRRVERRLGGHPRGSPSRIVWNPSTMFLVCMCQPKESSSESMALLADGFVSESEYSGDDSDSVAELLAGPPSPTSASQTMMKLKQKITDRFKKGSNKMRRKLSRDDKEHHDAGHAESDPFAEMLEQEKVAVVWDLMSGRRDRMTFGIAAESLVQYHESLVSPLNSGVFGTDTHHRSQDGFVVASMMGVSLLRIDADHLLAHGLSDASRVQQQGGDATLPGLGSPSPVTMEGADKPTPRRRTEGGSGPIGEVDGGGPGAAGGGSGGAGELSALTLALGLLHRWGLDSWTDSKMLRMLAIATSDATESPAGSSRGSSPRPQQTPQKETPPLPVSGILLARGALCSRGATTVQLPLPLDLLRVEGDDDMLSASAKRMEQAAPGGSSSSIREHREAVEEQEEAVRRRAGMVPRHWWGDLWLSSPDFVRQRLLVITALANRIMALGNESEAMCNGAAALVTLYALRMQDPSLSLALPSLSYYAVLWQSRNTYIRDAARSLLNAATGPAVTGAAHMSPLKSSAATSDTGSKDFRLTEEMREVIALYASTAPRTPGAEAIMGAAVSIIVSGSTCLAHWDQVPARLFQATGPLLAELACLAPAPHAESAARLLSEGFLSVGAERWKVVMSRYIVSFIDRVFSLCEVLSNDPVPEKPQTAGGGGAAGGGSGVFGFGGGGDADAFLPPGGTAATPPTSSRGSGGVTSVRQRLVAAFRQTGGSSHLDSISSVDKPTRVACRESLTTLIPAIASADLPLFLHVLTHRFAAVREDSLTHMMALISLVHLNRMSPMLMVPHLPLLFSVIFRCLDPSHPVLRRSCAEGVSAVVKELCMRCPMLTLYHSTAGSLVAVGHAVPAAPGGEAGTPVESKPGSGRMLNMFRAESSDHEGPSQEVIGLYDMVTGLRKRILVLPSAALNQSPGISAIAFSPDGAELVAFSASDGCLRLWALSSQWASWRWTKSPVVTEAHRQQEMLDPSDIPPPLTSSGNVELGYKLQWREDNQIVLSHRNRVLAEFHADVLSEGAASPGSSVIW